ncbi:MAG: 2-oxoacid:ferredoxin oxidoreductase subunit beta [Anaerolineae bacterium]|jgi:2-oxoglutarate/2-oxoacid ferredoxin oxidoreductase subunit beta|nr:2-oxoacid:ferredoxin oxidoreductase subunit beta [Anaerolineae bacterium]MBT7072421.1 2-oxoacid:ferredoxin oxidoreductase subunit beta [Anaerolineae bacterium]MBT7326582.1 2-oxoacid:ferredoxin oxidoreductase subunit beta [Anaerolineae bacterium]
MAATNKIGLEKGDYKGAPTTLCQGCGHNSILSQIIAACYEMNMAPEDIVKFSGIGCSSKAPTYMLDRSFGFNGLHGRMPAIATGAMLGDTTLTGIAMSGDGDSVSIGMGQFKHAMRRNISMLYIIANNGTYGLTKGQLSATSEVGLTLKKQATNALQPIDICVEAMASNATFVARSFAGDPKQVKTLIKAALRHNGTAILDIISPCVTFNNADSSYHSYGWGRENKNPIHDLSFIPARDEIMIEDYEEGTMQDVAMHDGSVIRLKKLERDYDPTNRMAAVQILEESSANKQLLTGLIYIDPNRPSFVNTLDLSETPLNRMTDEELRPGPETINDINVAMF